MNQLKLASLGFALAAASGCAQEAEPFADSSSTGSGAPDGLLSYRFQREVKVIGPVVPGYSLSFTIDHASLVTAGKARDDGNDVRLAFQKDGAPVELHRVIDPSSQWDATNTLLWFRTPDEGPPPSTYTLYYGHEAPEPPLADPGKVYDLWEDFSGGVDSTWKFTKLGAADGNYETKEGALRLSGQSNDFAGTADDGVFFHRDAAGDFTADAAIAAVGGSLGATSKMGGLLVRQSVENDASFAMVSIQELPRQRVSVARTGKGKPAEGTALAVGPTFPQLVEITRLGGQLVTSYSEDGRSWISLGAPVTLSDLADPVLLGVPFANVSSDVGFAEVAWLRVYKRVAAPPVPQLGPEG